MTTNIPSITGTGCGISARTSKGKNCRLVTAPVETRGGSTGRSGWRIASDVMLEDVDLFAGFFFACEREDGLPRLRLWRFSGEGPEAAQTA